MNKRTRKLMFATGTNDRATPRKFFRALDEEFEFVIDVCATKRNRKLTNYFGPDHRNPKVRDALAITWPRRGPCFMNPPYGAAEEPCKKRCRLKRCRKRGWHRAVYAAGCYEFVRKAADERLSRGVTTVALLAARTDTAWFHEFIWDAAIHQPRHGVQVRFLEGRLSFGDEKDPAPFPSMVVVFKGTRGEAGLYDRVAVAREDDLSDVGM